MITRWADDGNSVLVFEPTRLPARVFRLRFDGRREPLRTLTPADLSGAIAIHRLVMTPNGEGYAYTLERQLSDLYVATGFASRRTRIGWRSSGVLWGATTDKRRTCC